jgi:hypothetical protein
MASNSIFGDPCAGKAKKLAVVATCSGGTVDQCPNDPNKTVPGICGCGVADTDSDKDGIADCKDGCVTDPAKTAPGICGCGVADTDSDKDGTADCKDGCKTDPAKTAPGICGCGKAEGTCLISTRYEAEAFSSQIGCSVRTSYPGYTGKGYVDYGGNGTWAQWTNIKAPKAGQFKLTFRYASAGTTSRLAAVIVNGVRRATVSFTPTGAWTTWKTVQVAVPLNLGTNSLRVKATTIVGGPNLDSITVSQ